jgi:hypothetical protein
MPLPERITGGIEIFFVVPVELPIYASDYFLLVNFDNSADLS